jgi:ubiquinone/menaquinone biosynthesis C-methylase UbiE
VSNTLQKIKNVVSRYVISRPAISMWEKRAKQYGVRAALNIGHAQEQMEAVTRMQREKIFPFLKGELTGGEKIILDLGCGPGRFTADLAGMIHGDAIGVDPIQQFLDMAPKSENVEYRLMKEGIIPVSDKGVDVAWICLVLGGIVKQSILLRTVSEVYRVLKENGLIILVENTTDNKDGEYWKFRSAEFYQSLFNFAKLRHLSDYYDLGERISILAGRKGAQA